MYQRKITAKLQDALSDTPVVLLNGARQVGKSTLVRTLPLLNNAAYLTLDDAGVLSAIVNDPAGFIAGLSGPIIIDEVQHAPRLFPAIKAEVDRNRQAGRFLLTGSANVMLLPKISESLAGRIEILTLWPLAQAEISPEPPDTSIVDLLFEGNLNTASFANNARSDIINRLVCGGYPEPLSRKSDTRRHAWFESYLASILQRDVREIANIEGLTHLPRLLSLLAARTASLLNLSDISRSTKLPYTTLGRYMSLLESTFLIKTLPAWSNNLTTRLVKSPKIIFGDTGLAASLLGLTAERLHNDSNLLGPLFENFVAMEVVKSLTWSNHLASLYHYRTQAGIEVDMLLEDRFGQVVGIEVKSSSLVESSDFKGLRTLKEALGQRFIRGIVIYTGDQVLPFAENLHALPVSALWQYDTLAQFWA